MAVKLTKEVSYSRLGLNMFSQENALGDDKYQHQSHKAKQLKVDPGRGRKIKCHVQIHNPHRGKEQHPGPIKLLPGCFGQADLLLHHLADEVLFKYGLADEQRCRKTPVQNAWFPFDECFIVEINGGTAKQADDDERHPEWGVDFFTLDQQIRDLPDVGDDGDGCCQQDGRLRCAYNTAGYKAGQVVVGKCLGSVWVAFAPFEHAKKEDDGEKVE